MHAEEVLGARPLGTAAAMEPHSLKHCPPTFSAASTSARAALATCVVVVFCGGVNHLPGSRLQGGRGGERV